MAWQPKGGKGAKGKGKSKGKAKIFPKKEEPVEEVDMDGDEDGEEVEVGGDDEDWLAFQSACLAKLIEKGTLTAGKLGHELNAKKKPVCAALFSLAESGMVEMTEGIPPRWTAKPELDMSELVIAPISPRFLFDAEAKRSAGPRSSKQAFDTLKLLVRSHFGKGNGVTAGYLGFNLGATKKTVNAALYSLEKEGIAWTVSDRESGIKLRWNGEAAKCDEALPACFAYGGGAEEADGAPPAKRARITSNSNTGSGGNDFEDMKMVCWACVASKGEAGISSGALGHAIAADRKAITAALFSCASEGKVQNISEAGPPKWVVLEEPPAEASDMEVPAKFAYKGLGAAKAGGAVTGVNIAGLTAKQQAVLARKGGGKGAAIKPAAGGAQVNPNASPISQLNEFCQKNSKSISFQDAGQDASGSFVCRCVVDNEEVADGSASNKKQAKNNAAVAALEALGLQ